MNKKKTGIRVLINALFYSLDGLGSAFKSERAFRQEVILTFILIALTFYLSLTNIERVLLISSLFIVLIVELINSAIEAVVDRISLEEHHLSKKAKDIGSAAVLIALINAVITWVLILCN